MAQDKFGRLSPAEYERLFGAAQQPEASHPQASKGVMDTLRGVAKDVMGPLGPITDMLAGVFTNPENISTGTAAVGSLAGRQAGGALGAFAGPAAPVAVPVGMAAGAALGGYLGSKYGEGKDTSAAMKEGAMEAMFEGPGAAIRPASRGLQRGGELLTQHAFGPQAAVVKEFGEDVTGDVLEQLTKLKLERTGVRDRIGGRTIINKVQSLIDSAAEGRNAVMAGAAGDRPVSTRALWSPVESPTGDVVDPMGALFDRMRQGAAPRSTVQGAAKELSGVFDDPRITRYAKVQRPKPATLAQLQEPNLSKARIKSILKDIAVEAKTPRYQRTLQPEMSARDLQELVSGTYKRVDEMGGYANDAATSAKRDVLKAVARGGKEEYTRVVPEAIPFNEEMRALIPLREALIAAEARGQSMPLVRLGETFALSGQSPSIAIGSLLNRPKAESMLGQALYNMGKAGKQVKPETLSALTRLAVALARGGPKEPQ